MQIAMYDIALIALTIALLATVWWHFKVVSELMDRIMLIQQVPVPQREIPEIKNTEEEEEKPNPRRRHIRDRVRFPVGV